MAGRITIDSKLYTSDYYALGGGLAIKLPMNNNRRNNESAIFNLSFTTEEQSVSNYINLLLTNPGERFMQPNFGVGLLNYIFEPNTLQLQTLLDAKIREQTSAWLPYIAVQSIDILNVLEDRLLDENAVNIIIKFSVKGSDANRELTFTTTSPGNLNIGIT